MSFRSLFFVLPLLLSSLHSSIACTNILVTRGASADSSVSIVYTCDGEFHPILQRYDSEDFAPGDSMEIRDWYGNLHGKIHQVPHTYSYVRLINEYQVAIGETTFDGILDLKNPDGLLHYWELMQIALQRAKTAREAIEVITSLVEQYGYRSTGESFSIGDKNEAWILEMIGPGPGKLGAAWVAMRIPDGMISAHANKARIGVFPMDDPENCIYSKNVVSIAVENGLYDPDSSEPFNFAETYCPSTPRNKRYASTRVWSIFRRAAPAQNFSPDYHRAVEGAEPYPLWIKPDKKLELKDIFSLIRDHYEGTDYDMTKGLDSGPYNTPNRWRPMDWTVDSTKYAWERPISTQQTGFSFVSQSRNYMPDYAGGVLWYGVDDTYFTCYVPLYCSITDIPHSFTVGKLSEFSWESAWWNFNFVANYANLYYCYMKDDIIEVQSSIESNFLDNQSMIESEAMIKYKNDPETAIKYFTDYSVTCGEMVTDKWRELGQYLIRKYNDGYIQKEPGRASNLGYPDEWLQKIIEDRPEQFKMPENKEKKVETRLID